MKKSKNFNIPYSVGDLSVKVLLFEKTRPKLEGVNFCCRINDIPIYIDPTMERAKVITGSKTDSIRIGYKHVTFLVVGYESEEVKTDSLILQALSVLIGEVYNKFPESIKTKL